MGPSEPFSTDGQGPDDVVSKQPDVGPIPTVAAAFFPGSLGGDWILPSMVKGRVADAYIGLGNGSGGFVGATPREIRSAFVELARSARGRQHDVHGPASQGRSVHNVRLTGRPHVSARESKLSCPASSGGQRG